VTNVETVAVVPTIMRRGGDWYQRAREEWVRESERELERSV
jgi:NADH:ubiquinone oxidoreductase subunit F (NADH-binding)